MNNSMAREWAGLISVDAAPVLVPTDRAVTIGLVITELVINANKYAYEGKAGPIEVSLEEHRTNLRVIVADHGKGKHTTTAARLIDLNGFLYIDTPGVRALALCGDGTGLDLAFPEITEAALGCQFADCSHRREPGCAVRAAVDGGRIRRDRFDSYQLLVDEIIANDPDPNADL